MSGFFIFDVLGITPVVPLTSLVFPFYYYLELLALYVLIIENGDYFGYVTVDKVQKKPELIENKATCFVMNGGF